MSTWIQANEDVVLNGEAASQFLNRDHVPKPNLVLSIQTSRVCTGVKSFSHHGHERD